MTQTQVKNGTTVWSVGQVMFSTHRKGIPQGICVIDKVDVDNRGIATYICTVLPPLGTKQKPKGRRYTGWQANCLKPLNERYRVLSEALETLDARIVQAQSYGGQF